MQDSGVQFRCNSPTWCTTTTQDVNVQAGQLRGWQQEYNQLTEGIFHGAIMYTDIGPFHVFQEHTSRALQQFCRIPEGAIWLGFSTGAKRVGINFQNAGFNDIMVRPGGIDFELTTGNDSSLFGVVIAPDTLPGQATTTPSQLAHILTTSKVITLRRYMTMLSVQRQSLWQTSTHQQLLHDALADILPLSGDRELGVEPHNRGMNAVRAYLCEVSDDATVTVAGLARVAGVSPRALQRLFYDYYGVSPARFLQARRLNQVRRSLQNNSKARYIADIAFNHGFFHLSQFSKQYKRLFGELPSQTVQNNHKVCKNIT